MVFVWVCEIRGGRRKMPDNRNEGSAVEMVLGHLPVVAGQERRRGVDLGQADSSLLRHRMVDAAQTSSIDAGS